MKIIKKQQGFTLIESVIVVVILGIIAALLLPNLTNILPDRNLALFKKGNTTIASSVRELVNSDKYYAQGNFALDSKGRKVKSYSYFCESLADTLQTKSVNCIKDRTTFNGFVQIHITSGVTSLLGYKKDNNIQAAAKIDVVENEKLALSIEHDINTTTTGTTTINHGIISEHSWYSMDDLCEQYSKNGAEIVLNNGIVLYQAGNGLFEKDDKFRENEKRTETIVFSGSENENISKNTPEYKLLCMDVDGLNKGETSFAYGIRNDGKILLGCKAYNWSIKTNKDSSKEISCEAPSLEFLPAESTQGGFSGDDSPLTELL